MNKYLIPFLFLLVAGCSSTKKEKYTYFGGKIINPKSKYVILYKNNEVIDSIKINKNNRFISKLKNIKPGLYFFKHGIEHQYVYLEPKDSLLLRLNTWDFDESLVFTGTHADRNNVLIETFIQNEIDNKKFYKFYALNPYNFKQKIDSIKNEKLLFLENYKVANNETSSNFLGLLELALTYPLKTRIENFNIENYTKKIPDSLDSNFLSHRRNTCINKDSLMFYIPYRNYVYANLHSTVYEKNIKRESIEFTPSLLKNIATKITATEQKNRLLRHITIRHFYNNSSADINKKAFDTYFELSTNEKDKNRITKLLNDIAYLKNEQKTPSFKLLKPDGSAIYINEIIDTKKTVLYFTGKKYSADWITSRIKYLVNKNPEVQFLIINTNKHQYIPSIAIKHQYSLNEKSEAHRFLTSNYPRVILINKKGIIKNSYGALSSDKIETQIAKL